MKGRGFDRAERMMKISLATLSKRQDDVLDALKRNEKISISHNGQVVAGVAASRGRREA